ncbi:MAG: galactose-1-phosphate uridylyltransferase [Verrucomicrobiales bacterium]
MSDLHPHRRRNPLTGEWVLVSPHRMLRPWQGQVEKAVPDERPAFDPGCYLCPGNARAGGNQNPDYDGTFVFTNDFSAVLPEGSTEASGDPLFTAEPVRGECRVVCFSPRHDLTLAEMPEAAIGRVIETWQAQIAELGERYAWVQVFENKGAVMGCSNPHPHGQIWALDQMPMLPAREDARQRDYFAAHGSPMLADYAAREIADGARIICAGDSWVALVPYWATW